MIQQSNSWSLAIRYQAQAERHYRRAVEEFERLKALRQELPNEAILDPQPEPNEPLNPVPSEPIPPPETAAGGAGSRLPELPGVAAPVPLVLHAGPCLNGVLGSTHLSDTTHPTGCPSDAKIEASGRRAGRLEFTAEFHRTGGDRLGGNIGCSLQRAGRQRPGAHRPSSARANAACNWPARRWPADRRSWPAFADIYTAAPGSGAERWRPRRGSTPTTARLLDDQRHRRRPDRDAASTLHAEHFVAALEAGKHVYQEKTMALHRRHAKRMRAACQRAPAGARSRSGTRRAVPG